ncbi:unnamed protein product [Mycena citricolor]|uniref:Fruit-body specific protein a n=1 Tax=Mycena citricolor TaxID=2018698 RepID=A0AAD2HDG4_9AGAR|nr:unnamed protein product [Mycena citricolor]
MRFSGLFSALAVVSAVSAQSYNAQSITNAMSLTAQNHYGAPTPPWVTGHTPGWYYGQHGPPDGVILFLEGILCELLDLFPFCLHCPSPPKAPPHGSPPPPPEFKQSFYNLTCAAQDASYMTYGLVDTVADCQTMCDTVPGCNFYNSYHDVNGKNGSPQLTCALFSASCLNATSADNCGGQTQPDGSIDYIINSDGYCRNTPSKPSNPYNPYKPTHGW